MGTYCQNLPQTRLPHLLPACFCVGILRALDEWRLDIEVICHCLVAMWDLEVVVEGGVDEHTQVRGRCTVLLMHEPSCRRAQSEAICAVKIHLSPRCECLALASNTVAGLRRRQCHPHSRLRNSACLRPIAAIIGAAGSPMGSSRAHRSASPDAQTCTWTAGTISTQGAANVRRSRMGKAKPSCQRQPQQSSSTQVRTASRTVRASSSCTEYCEVVSLKRAQWWLLRNGTVNPFVLARTNGDGAAKCA